MEPQQPQRQIPIGHDGQGRPIYSDTPPGAPLPPVIDPYTNLQQHQQTPAQAQPASHVTNAPQPQVGQSFDPQARVQYGNEPGVRHASRPIEPEPRGVSDELKRRHEESKRRYPFLNLSEGEVVILDIKRHPIGLLIPLGAGGIIIVALLSALIFYPADPEIYNLPSFGLMTLIIGLIMALVGIGTFIAVWVYLQNQFFMTNESVIQEIQHSLFSRHEQTVSLGSIEDASFKKTGILQTFLDYGTIRLSTEGEETTYRFHFVAQPREQVAIINNGIEAFKNGRPVELDS